MGYLFCVQKRSLPPFHSANASLPQNRGWRVPQPDWATLFSFCVSHKCHSQSITHKISMCRSIWEAKSPTGLLLGCCWGCFVWLNWGQGALRAPREPGSAAVLPAGRAAHANAAPHFSLGFFCMGPGIKSSGTCTCGEPTEKLYLKKKKRTSLH